jgi:hypothetical protein
MTGDFIDAVARRVVSPETHRAVVLPALADLQYEVRTCHVHHTLRAYVGAWNAILASMLHDAAVAVQRPGFVMRPRRLRYSSACRWSITAACCR